MAQQGMFGNYQQQIADETALRRQQSQTGGLTGWAAITNAMSGIGSEIGYAGGQALGGMTPAQQQQASFQAVMDSVPNYDPTNPDSMMEMSAALQAGGFYDQGLKMFQTANKIKSDNLMYKVAELEYKNLKNPKTEPLSVSDQINFDQEILDKKAISAVQTMPQNTYAEQQEIQEYLFKNGLAGSSLYKELNDKLGTTKTESEVTGTAENQALKQKRNEFIENAKGDETAGNEAFLAYTQGLDLANATAAAKIDLGTSIFKSTMVVRDKTAEKLGKISTGISQFTQALAGSPAAAEIAETLIAQVFEDKRQATSEIQRIASAGNLVENVGDFVNKLFSGTKSAEHYAAFIKTLQIYEQEQLAKYNESNDSMRKIGVDYSFDIPESVFKVYVPRDGTTNKQIKQWNPKTRSFDLVDKE